MHSLYFLALQNQNRINFELIADYKKYTYISNILKQKIYLKHFLVEPIELKSGPTGTFITSDSIFAHLIGFGAFRWSRCVKIIKSEKIISSC